MLYLAWNRMRRLLTLTIHGPWARRDACQTTSQLPRMCICEHRFFRHSRVVLTAHVHVADELNGCSSDDRNSIGMICLLPLSDSGVKSLESVTTIGDEQENLPHLHASIPGTTRTCPVYHLIHYRVWQQFKRHRVDAVSNTKTTSSKTTFTAQRAQPYETCLA